MSQNPAIIGLISDTHGLLREEALNALKGSDLIIHAGDVGEPGILERLKEIAPVVAVRGNVDKGAWALALPLTAVAEAGSVMMYVLHDLEQLDIDPAAAGFQFVISGHSHKPVCTQRAGVYYVNPGSAGPLRFRLPITVCIVDLKQSPWSIEFLDLAKDT
ncbi:MAG TPA: metallophosphoesterase family protein [Bryobacteraceae bacterium]|nr:metallophosphoesterase family protein [Bryobacteraceae bacterium]